MAFVIGPLCLLLFGIIDFGFAYNDYVSVRQGARDGAREMAVDSAPTPPGQAPGQLYNCGVTVGGTYGTSVTFPGDNVGEGKGLVCMTKAKVGLDDDKNTRVSIWFDQTAGWVQDEQAIVCVQYPFSSRTGITGVFLDGKTIKTRTEIHLEQPTVTAGPDSAMAVVQEDALSTWPANCTQ